MKIKNSTVLTLLAPALVAARHYRRRTAFAEITRTEASNCGVLSEMAALINSSDCGINLCFKDGTTMSPTQAPGNSSTTTTTTKGTTTTTTTAKGTTTTTTTKATTTTTTTKASATPTTPSAIHVGTYLPNWFVYKKLYMGMSKLNVQGAAASESDLVSTYNYWAQDLVGLAPKLTHLYYAFWDVGKDCKVVDRDPDASWYGKGPSEPTWIEKKGKCAGLMNDMMALKSQFPHLKLLISLGGWTYSQNFSTCASTVANREMLWRTTNYRLNEMDANWAKPGAIWDGIDFDWEFPGVSEGLAPSDSSVIWYRDEDWKNYVLLATLFRDSAKSAGRTQIELTTAIGVGTSLRNLANDPATAVAFCNIMDGVNLMEYDIHGKWDPTTGHNAPFCYDTRDGNPSMAWNVKETVDSLIAAGCPPAKLILGLPNYSHAWTRIPAGPDGNGLFQKATDTSYYQDAQGNEFGKWVGWSSFSDGDSQWVPQGIVSYWDLKDELAKNSDLKVFSWDCPIDEGIVVPIKHVYSATKQAFASYEDPDTIQKKTQWAKSKGLGGFFFWDAQQDRKGDILDAAIQGFGGLPTNPASGTAKCFDGNKPDFDVDPDTGKPIVFECKSGGTKYVVVSGDTCFGLKTKLGSSCSDGTPALQASYRAGETECKQICSEDFTGAGKDDMWLGDEIYYKC